MFARKSLAKSVAYSVALLAVALAGPYPTRATAERRVARVGKIASDGATVRPVDAKYDPAVSQSGAIALSDDAFDRIAVESAASGHPLFVRYSAMTNTPRVVYGDLGQVPAAGGNAVTDIGVGAEDRDALRFLAANAQVYGLDVNELVLARVVGDVSARHYYYEQRYKGLPVFYAEVSVHIDGERHVRGLTNSFVPLTPKPLTPAVSSGDAFGAAVRGVGVADSSAILREFVSDATLGILPTSDGGRLAWRVLVPSRDPVGLFEVFVDAMTGEILADPENIACAFDGHGKVFVPNPVVSESDVTLSDRNGSATAVPASAYNAVTLTGLDGSGKLIGPYFQVAAGMPNPANRPDGDFSDIDRSSPQFDEVEAYWAISFAQGVFRDLGFTAANNKALADFQLPVYAHDSPYWRDADNSSFFPDGRLGPGTGHIEYGTGGVDDAQDAEIVLHEYGHAVLYSQRPGIVQNIECEGLGEGWADYFESALVRRMPGASSYYVTEGEWDAVSYNPGNPPFLRRMDTNQTYPNSDSNCEVHRAGQTWSRALFEIDNAIGADAGLRLELEANYLLDLSPTQPEAAAAVLAADQMINGGRNAAVITNAFVARNVMEAAPSITGVRFKKANGTAKLIVDGSVFASGTAVVEVNGFALAATKYPAKFSHGGLSTRLVATGRHVSSAVPRGVAVQITVLNPGTGARSAPLSFTR